MKIGQRFWLVIGGVSLIGGGLIIAAYHFDWTGTGFEKKTLWDWLQLLIVPLALAIIAVFFNIASTRAEQKIATQRYEDDKRLALDKQREDLLQTYLDNISALLLEKELCSSKPKDEIVKVARVRTLTTLIQLDARRAEYVFSFLHEVGLMSNQPGMSIINLSHANLSKIDLSQASLIEADFSEADLTQANLSEADLSRANLSKANLHDVRFIGSDLTQANLRGANLIQANLSQASLIGADLSEANLSFADLRETNLRGAILRGAILNNAKLFSYQLSEEQMKQAKSYVNIKHNN